MTRRNGRIEMHLVSLARQTVRVLGRAFTFAEGERIHTENSHKYSVAEFQALGGARRLDAGPGLDRPGPGSSACICCGSLSYPTTCSQPGRLARQCAPRPRQQGVSLRG